MKLLSEQKALGRLQVLKSDFKSKIAENYEHRAKSCATCETPGACCLDEHFVNVHISRLEAVAIKQALAAMPQEKQEKIYAKSESTVEKYDLAEAGDTFAKTYACPLFEKGTGCIVHATGKPLPCIQHACYENAADLPPDELLAQKEIEIDALNRRTYGSLQPLLPIPLAIRVGNHPIG